VYVQTPLEPLERHTAVKYADMSCSKAPSFVAKFSIKCQSREAVVQSKQK
jgi:hypothetical protein